MKLAALRDNTPVVVTASGNIKLSDIGFNGTLDELVRQDASVLTSLNSSVSGFKGSFIAGEFGPPLRYPSKIVAIGLNYVDHASESKMELPKSPLVFTKFPNSIIGPGEKIKIPLEITQRVDYEVELGVIIGKRAKNVKKEDALKHVFGYTVLNDVSARDLQFNDGQWVRGKSLDTFCPLGPVIVTADEIIDVQNLKLSCEVNGQVLQNDSTANMIFGIAELISVLSHSFTFEPGDIIATGTPSGVGFSRKPPIYLKNGDVVKTSVEGIGELINYVVEI